MTQMKSEFLDRVSRKRLAAIETTIGMQPLDTDLGTFPGVTITDNPTVKVALTELEAAVENVWPTLGLPVGAAGFTPMPFGWLTDGGTALQLFQDTDTHLNTIYQTIDWIANAQNPNPVPASTYLTINTGGTPGVAGSGTYQVMSLMDLYTQVLAATPNALGLNVADAGGFYVGGDVETVLQELGQDSDDLWNIIGVPVASPDLGTFAGGIIPPNLDVKAALQALELEHIEQDALNGVPDNQVHMGTFTGATIPDNVDIKTALQSLETGLESITLTQQNLVADIAARDALTAGQADFAYVLDASADPTVATGAALYIYDAGAGAWQKVAEFESMDVTGAATALGIGTHLINQLEVTSSTGGNVFLPMSTPTLAGAITGTQHQWIDWISLAEIT